MKGMAIPAVPRSDDRSVYQHHVGRGQGGVQVMTTISRVVLEVPRRRQGGVVLELPRSRLQKANALARAAILR